MQTKQLGHSDLHLTPIVLSTWAIVGGRNAKQVKGSIGVGEFRLNQQERDEIQQFLNKNS